MAIQPYSSLVQFTQGQAFLNPEEAAHLYDQIQQLFAELAYRDETAAIPLEMIERLHQIDLPMMHAFGKDSFTQLLANISKVAQVVLQPIQQLAIYQIKVPDPENPDEFYWGWIERSYVDTSELLKKQLNDQGVLVLEGTAPAALWALQRVQRLEYNVPISCREALLKFFEQWNLQKLKKDFLSWTPIPHKRIEEPQTTLFDPQDPYGSLKRFASRCTSQQLHSAEAFTKAFAAFFKKAAFEGQRIPIPSQRLSRLVKRDLPFLRTISSLEEEEEIRLIASIQQVAQVQMSSVFQVECRFGKQADDYLHRWIKPPKIDWIESDPRPLHSLVIKVSCEQAFAGELPLIPSMLVELLLLSFELKFPELRKMLFSFAHSAFSDPQSQIEISTAICHHFENPGMSPFLEELKALLTPDPAAIDPKLFGPIFLHNLRVKPKMALIKVMEATFGSKTPDPPLLQELYEQVEEDRRGQLIDLFVQIVYMTLKPSLHLGNLQGFCRQLATGETYYVHNLALGFYHFLSSTETKALFPHPELLQQMINAFPRYYPAVLAKDQLDHWRRTKGEQLDTAFESLSKEFNKNISYIFLDFMICLQKCFCHVAAKEEMAETLQRTFAAAHRFDDLRKQLPDLLELFKRLEPFVAEGCPEIIQEAYHAFFTLATELLTFSQKMEFFKEFLKPFEMREIDADDRLMNLIWRYKHSYTVPMEKPLSTPLQVKWLSILEQLPDSEKMEHSEAAKLLCHPASPDLPLNLFHLQKKMEKRQLSPKAQDWIIGFQESEKMTDEALLALEEPAAMISFLKEESLPTELQLLKERLLSLLEPTMLSRSMLWLSQLSTSWKPT